MLKLIQLIMVEWAVEVVMLKIMEAVMEVVTLLIHNNNLSDVVNKTMAINNQLMPRVKNVKN